MLDKKIKPEQLIKSNNEEKEDIRIEYGEI